MDVESEFDNFSQVNYPHFHESGNFVLDLFSISICLEIIIGNLLVIIVALRYKCFGSKSTNRYIISLAVSDLTIGVIVIPLNILEIAKYHLLFLFQEISVISSIFNLTVLSMDRYMAIRKPISYSRKLTTRQVNINIFLVWFSTLVIVKLPHIMDYACIGTHDEDSAICDFLHGKEILVVILLLIFYIPLILMISFNVGTYRLALASLTLKRRRSRLKTKFNYITNDENTGVNSVDLDGKEMSRFSALMIQHKLYFTLGLIMLVFIVCWAPFFIVSTIICLCSECTQFLAPIHNFAIWLGVVNSGMNPIIHFILSRKFRTSIKSLFCLTSASSKSYVPRLPSVTRSPNSSNVLPSKLKSSSNGI